MPASKAERLKAILIQLEVAGPFSDGVSARDALAEIMERVEDQMSGVPSNPNSVTAPTDGRMYPPDDRFEISSGSSNVRTFKHVRHRTSIGKNGAVMITLPSGEILFNKPGLNGKTIDDLLSGENT